MMGIINYKNEQYKRSNNINKNIMQKIIFCNKKKKNHHH